MINFMFVIGRKASGKTKITKETYLETDRSERKNNTLVFDIFDEYKGIEEIRLSDVLNFSRAGKGNIARVIANKYDHVSTSEMFLGVLRDFREGVLIGDCCVDMAKKNEIFDVIFTMLMTSKLVEQNLHIVLHFQDIKMIPQKIMNFYNDGEDNLILIQEMGSPPHKFSDGGAIDPHLPQGRPKFNS
jgi:hypothetical protein